MSAEERLEQMEQELTVVNRRYSRLLLLVGGLTTAALALAWNGTSTPGPTSSQEVVRAQEFILEGPSGEVRARLASLVEGGTVLRLRDENGRLRAALGASENEGTTLLLFDGSRTARVALGTMKRGPALSLSDANGQRRAQLGASEATGVGLGMYDGNGVLRATLGQDNGSWTVGLADRRGYEIWSTP